jgi:hypothetical protein
LTPKMNRPDFNRTGPDGKKPSGSNSDSASPSKSLQVKPIRVHHRIEFQQPGSTNVKIMITLLNTDYIVLVWFFFKSHLDSCIISKYFSTAYKWHGNIG